MTENSNPPVAVSCATARRREAKRYAWDCFLRSGNVLLLIGATLIPIIMFVAGQGIYSMMYYAVDDPAQWLTDLMYVTNAVFYILTIPLIGGQMYVISGLSHGEHRELRDVFYPYTSFRAYVRTWLALLIPALAVAAVVGAVLMALYATQGLCELSALMEDGPALFYGDVFRYVGRLLSVLIAAVGLVLLGYLMPFFWLVFSRPEMSVKRLLANGISMSHRGLIGWLVLQCSFLGWLVLSVTTVGILLVVFVIPYYLLTVTRYTDLLWADKHV